VEVGGSINFNVGRRRGKRREKTGAVLSSSSGQCLQFHENSYAQVINRVSTICLPF